MNEKTHEEFSIQAVYERVFYPKPGRDSGTGTYHDQTLRVDKYGNIPSDASQILLQINIEGDPRNYRIPIPEEFKRLGYFIIMAADLPVEIPYGKSVYVSVIERYGDGILTRVPLKYRTVKVGE